MEMIKTLQRVRTRAGEAGPTKTTVYNFLSGETHALGQEETRGRPAEMSNTILKALDQTRYRLNREASNEYRVTRDMITESGAKALRRRGLIGRCPMKSKEALCITNVLV